MYLKKSELSRVVTESQNLGTLTDEFLAALRPIVEGVRQRFGRMEETDDLFQDAVILVLRHLGKLDPTKNLFGYLTTLVKNEVTKRHRVRTKQEKLARGVWEKGRPRFRDSPHSIDKSMKG